ncbi:MAG: thioredoxin family protein [Calditrichia bacterium]|nr:thioredoxin family protein [Calditrichia bacterium]
MAFLEDKDKKFVEKTLSKLVKKVNILFFTKVIDCEYCSDTHQLLNEITNAGKGNINLEIYDLNTDKEKAEEYKIDKTPAIVLMTEKDHGIRYYGIPSGYEFSSLLEDIQRVAKEESGLSDATKEQLKKIDKPVHLQVFVTPTCPHCPKAVTIAHQFAMENVNIIADMVEASEFQELSAKYRVQGVPRTVIGDEQQSYVEGSVPEHILIDSVLEGYNKIYNL